jgi:large subunit ribosomal protein L30
MAAEKKTGTVRVTLVRGLMGKKPDHRDTVRGLGLKWRNHTVELQDTPQTRGMINKVGYMLRVAETAGPSGKRGVSESETGRE